MFFGMGIGQIKYFFLIRILFQELFKSAQGFIILNVWE